ncbi:MAG: MAE_28990/MAE_18760 family HEPN-like nuclease, partial [Bacilli bacterium]
MFESLENNAIKKIEIIINLVNTHNTITDSLEPQDRIIAKEFYLSATVTKIYAILENFINEIISDYLDILSEVKSFSELSNAIKKEYRIGISHILSKLDQKRYEHLVHEDIVKWYYEATHNIKNYRFVAPALTRQEENYRLEKINTTFNRIDLCDFQSWVSNHTLLKVLFPLNDSIYTTLDSELKDFINLRNDASHGTLTNLEGDNSILTYTTLIINIIKVITSFFRKTVINIKEDKKLINELGNVTELFKKVQANIITCKKDSYLTKDLKVLILNNNECYIETIQSLQDQGINIDEITIPNDNYELGVIFQNSVSINSKIY